MDKTKWSPVARWLFSTLAIGLVILLAAFGAVLVVRIVTLD